MKKVKKIRAAGVGEVRVRYWRWMGKLEYTGQRDC